LYVDPTRRRRIDADGSCFDACGLEIREQIERTVEGYGLELQSGTAVAGRFDDRRNACSFGEPLRETRHGQRSIAAESLQTLHGCEARREFSDQDRFLGDAIAGRAFAIGQC